jgi:hypothetical protein
MELSRALGIPIFNMNLLSILKNEKLQYPE